MPLPDLGALALVALVALLVAGALSPIETLGWWAGWYGDTIDELEADPARAAPGEAEGDDAPPRRRVDPWVVFLTGIHAVDHVTFDRAEARLVARLRRALPEGRVVEVFPYSVTNRALTGERVFARVWRWALRGKVSGRRLGIAAGSLINMRNLWQVLVSADRRYGPFYNQGTAELVLRSLRRRGFVGGGRLVLIGYSGGAQIALGAAPFLAERTGARVEVVSLGGVMCADPGLLAAAVTWHLSGSRDRLQAWAGWAFPGRWPLLRWSPWNLARERGTLRRVTIGPCDHTGRDGYLDERARVADGRSYFDVTADVLAAAARGETRLPVAAT